tara:strand:- start:356 stop:2029 length:1674 start_codon:yes stop_codon:yes gene_type:complete
VLAEDGQKMSKRKKNYPPPEEVIKACGADALRLYLINSPVVRADDLRFKKEGVKQNLRDIFLPWYHAYRLFVQSASAQERQSGASFQPNATLALASSNVMDRWILAAANSLVAFMRCEMEAYRLYTVVPRLVQMVEQLTNWYIRMNKERFAGERGTEAQTASLSTLFEVLHMLCRMMAPLTPFFCELMYRNLRRAVPNAAASVHFLMIPEVIPGAIDMQIESDVHQMQQTIEKGRAIRDRNTLSARTPLPEVSFIHHDLASLQAVEKLQEYIKEELNVRSLTTALVSEVPGLVQLKCLPNHRVLGARFGSDYKQVQAMIRALKHEELTAFMSSGCLAIGEHYFSSNDILVQIEYRGDRSVRDADEVDGGLVLLHCHPDTSMLAEAMAREVCAKVQKMRKEAHLRKSDEIETCFSCAQDSLICRVLTQQAEYVANRIGIRLTPLSARPACAVSLFCKQDEVRTQALVEGKVVQQLEQLTLELVRGFPALHAARLAQLVPDEALRADVGNYVLCLDLASLRQRLCGSDELRFMLNGQAIALKLGHHLFFSQRELFAAQK